MKVFEEESEINDKEERDCDDEYHRMPVINIIKSKLFYLKISCLDVYNGYIFSRCTGCGRMDHVLWWNSKYKGRHNNCAPF